MTSIAPDLERASVDSSDDDLCHIVCDCDDYATLCGAPAGEEWDVHYDVRADDCVVCLALDDALYCPTGICQGVMR